jgi:hypothetical protein
MHKQNLRENQRNWIVCTVLIIVAAAAGFCRAQQSTSQSSDLQRMVDAAPTNSIVRCDPNQQFTISVPISIRKAVTVVGLHARLPEKLSATPLLIIEAKGVAITDFELVGNADSVPQKERAPLVIIRAGDFRVERGQFINSSKDGVMIDADEAKEDIVGGIVRDIVGRGVRRDVVSISGSSGKNRRIRNVLVDNVRGYDSEFRGTVEVSDGTDNITVRKVYAESSVYAVDVQDHNQPDQSNRNIVIEDVYAIRCKHALRTANTRRGHNRLTVRDITAENCISPVQISHTANVHLSNVRVIGHESGKPPIHLQDCQGLTVRDVVVENASVKGAALLIEDCDETVVDGFSLRGQTNNLAAAVCFRISRQATFSGLRISNVSARNGVETGIILEATGKQKGTLTDYLVTGNLATVTDQIQGVRAMVLNNLLSK